MKWKGRRRSTNVIDARGRRASGGGLVMLLNLLFRTFGPKGLLVAAVVGIIAWQAGLIDPAALLGGGQVSSGPVATSPVNDERLQFVEVVLADTEDIWSRELPRVGASYQAPELVVFSDRVSTGCGAASARSGPFYCPADRRIYIDLGFYDELENLFEAPGDFAQAYVIAHEVGHHIQTLLGISSQVAAKRGQPDYNEYSVRLELQADFLAGVWARHNQHYLDAGDIQEAVNAANRIGDDAIQSRTQGRVVPHAFTHGTSAQRMRWFTRGFESGRIEDGDTFQIRYEHL